MLGSWFAGLAGVAAIARAGAQAPTPDDDLSALEPGMTVELDHAVIRGISGNLMRVAHRDRELFVVPVNPSWLEFLTIGAIVDIHGALRKPPSARQAQLDYAIDRRTAARLARERFYIDAWAVTPSGA
jgi:hypothetical protein